MEDSFDVNGKAYVSSKRLAEKYGYTNDHISRLCRQGKVQGKRVARTWFVDEDDLVSYQSEMNGNGWGNGHAQDAYAKDTTSPTETAIAATPLAREAARQQQEARSQPTSRYTPEAIDEPFPNANKQPRKTEEAEQKVVPDDDMPNERGVKPHIAETTSTSHSSRTHPLLQPVALPLRNAVLFLSILSLFSVAHAVNDPTHRDALYEETAKFVFGAEEFLTSSKSLAIGEYDDTLASVASVQEATKTFIDTAALSVYRSVEDAKVRTQNRILSWLGIPNGVQHARNDTFYLGGLPNTGFGSETDQPRVVQETRVVERVVERQVDRGPIRAQTSGISRDVLETRLQEVENGLRQQIFAVRGDIPESNSIRTINRVVSHTNKIDKLNSVTISNATVDGVSGLTDSDIPDDITASNYLPLSGGTLTGALTGTDATFSGALTTQGSVTFYTEPSFPSFNATSTTATSTIAGSLEVDGDLTVSGSQSFSGGLTLPYFSATSTATSSSVAYRLGIGTTSPYATLSVSGSAVVTDNITASNFTATSSTASVFPYASSTAITTTSFFPTDIYSFTLQGDLLANGQNITGIGTATGTNSIFTNATTTNATSTNFFTSILDATTGTFTNLTTVTYDATSGTTTNATSTNFFTALLDATTGTITNFTATDATTTNATSTNLFTQNFTADGKLTLNGVGTDMLLSLNSANELTATSTPTLSHLFATSTTATSTFAGGINIGSGNFVVDFTTGFAGAGTAAPIAPLHVAGRCVTGDTRLRRRRRRLPAARRRRHGQKGAKGTTGLSDAELSKRGFVFDDDYVYDEVEITYVKEGDEVASLDPKTGMFVYSKVNNMMPMGIKPIVYIRTTTGRSIRTTENHPYLVRSAPPKEAEEQHTQKLYRFEVDQSVKIEDFSRDTVVAVANAEQSFTLTIPRKEKQRLRDNMRRFNKPKKLNAVVFALGIAEAMKRAPFTIHELAIDTEYIGYEHTIAGIIADAFPQTPEINFLPVGKKSPAHFAAIGVHKQEKTADTSADTAAFTQTENALRTAAFPTKARNLAGPGAFLNSTVYDGEQFVKRGVWTTVNDIRVGQYIAVAHGGTPAWERVEEMKILPEEQVYDIEIEGTHNFIGNDVVAHNTYLNGDVGIKQASPTYDLDVSGDARFTGLVDATRFVATSTTATSTFAGGLSAAGASGLTVLQDGTVGIGTTSPSSKLSVHGDALFSGDISTANLTATGTASISGTASITGEVTLSNTTGGILETDSSGTVSATSTINDFFISDALTISSSGSVADGALSSNVSLLGQTIESSEITDGTVANVDLANSSVSYGGVSVSLGDSDATPAFDLTDATNLPIVGGTTGTLTVARGGTGQSSFGQGWLHSTGGTSALTASTSPTVNYITATSTTATSTFAWGIKTTALDVTSTNATSTFANGIQLSSGCFLLPSGECAGTGSGSGGAFTSSGGFTTLSTETDDVGIGTSSPYAKLSVWGESASQGLAFNAVNSASTTLFSIPNDASATSTFATNLQVNGNLQVGTGTLTLDSGGITSSGAFQLNSGGANFTFPTSDGSNNQVLTTDGSGTLSFTSLGSNAFFSTSSTAIANDSFLELTHNSDTNDLLITGWVFNSDTSKWESVNENDNQDGYQNYKPITIDSTKASSTLTNFPLTFSVTDADLKTTGNGGDIQNTDSTGGASGSLTVPADLVFASTTACGAGDQLDHEVEKYNSSTGELVAHVRIPTLSGSSDTTIYMCYGDKDVATSQENVTGVWDSNYKMVQHMNEDPSGTAPQMYDSTSNNNDGTSNGSMTSGDQISGQIDGSIDYDGSDDYIQTSSTAISSVEFTVSAYLFLKSGQTGAAYILGQNSGGWTTTGLEIQFNAGDKISFSWTDGSSSDPGTARYIIQSEDYDKYTHFVFTRNSSGELNIYKNGSLVTGPVSNNTLTSNNLSYAIVGGKYVNNSGTNFTAHRLDEIKAYSGLRSAEWIATEYNNQSSTSTFYTVGSESSVNTQYAIEQTDSNTLRLYNYSGSSQQLRLSAISSAAAGEWTDQGTYISANNATDVVITDTSRLGIGTTSPSRILSLDGGASDGEDARLRIDTQATGGRSGIEFAEGNSILSMILHDISNDELEFWTNNAERMVVDNNGNVGIGETSPGSKLSVSGGGTFGSGYDTTAAPTNGLAIEGNVGIGTTSPDSLLHIESAAPFFTLQDSNDAGALDSLIRFTASDNGVKGSLGYVNSNNLELNNRFGNPLVFKTTNTEQVRIDANGNVGIGETSPGSKLSVSGGGTFGSGYDTTAAPTNGLAIEGNVGIGTTSPFSKLSVSGDIYADGNLTVSGLTATTSISAPYFTATDSSATSTFAGGINVSSGGLVYDHSTGNVGIGTESAGALLTLNRDSNNPIIKSIQNNRSRLIRLGENETNQFTDFGWVNTNYFKVDTGSSNFPIVLQEGGGNVGIGTTSPASTLDVWGDFRVGTSSTPTLFTDVSTGRVGIGTTSPVSKLAIQDGNLTIFGQGGGGNDSFTKLLIHADGSDGSTSFTDSSDSGHTITANGDAQIDTAQSKFGGSSALFDGTGDYLSAADSDDWYFDGDFTIDFWARLGTTASSLSFVTQEADTNNRWYLYFNNTNGLTFIVRSGGVNVVDVEQGDTTGWSTNTWYHIAVVKNGDTWTLYRDGSSIATIQDEDGFDNLSAELWVGDNTTDSFDLNGHIDELRVSKDVARWTNDFTPPTSAYSSGSSNAGYIGIGVGTPSSPVHHSSGAILTTGGSWTNASSRAIKENFTGVDSDELLAKINELDITQWNYIAEDPSITHIGPIAEDFYDAFELGGSRTSISSIDPAGIALVGIQGLYRDVSRHSSVLDISGIATTSSATTLRSLYNPITTASSTASTTPALFVDPEGNVGVGTTSPYARLSVAGGVVADYFRTASSTATSTFAGAIEVLNGTSTSFVITQDGRVGIGENPEAYGASTSTLEHALTVDGDVAATGFVNVSSGDFKKNVREVTEEEREGMLSKLRGLFVATYHYNREEYCGESSDDSISNSPNSSNSPNKTDEEANSANEANEANLANNGCGERLGLIAEQAPEEVLSEDGRGVDLYKFVTFVASAVQAIADKVEALADRVTGNDEKISELEERISELENQLSNSPNSPNSSNSPNDAPAAGDNEAPVITINGNNPAEVEVGASYNDLGAIVTDNEDDNLGVNASVNGTDVGDQSNVSIDTSVAGEHTVEYRATDNSGNTGTAVRTVIVGGDSANSPNSSNSPNSPNDTDGEDENSPNSSNNDESGSDDDSSGDSSTLEGNSSDSTAPGITLEGSTDITITVGDSYNEPGYSASDDTDGDITSEVVVGGDTVDTSTAGTYTITYNVSDAAGNAATEKTRTITVVEPEPAPEEEETSTDTATSTSEE